MKQKKYPISTLPEIIKISASDLRKLLKKNSHCLKVTKDKAGSYLDEESFRRLVFIKQLGSGGSLSSEEICELMAEPQVAEQKAEQKPQETVIDKVSRVLDDVAVEAQLLKEQLSMLAIKYDQALKELELSRSKNMILQNKISTLQHRQVSLMGHLRQSAEKLGEDELEPQLVN